MPKAPSPTGITIVAGGTRGDVQPLIALASGLLAANMPTHLITRQPFAALAQQYHVPTTLIQHDPVDLLQSSAGEAALTYHRGPLTSARATLRYLRQARPVFAQMLRETWEACQNSTALVVTLPTTWAEQIAEVRDIPVVRAFFQPLGPTSVFPSPLLPFGRSLGPGLNRASHRLVQLSLWAPWYTELNQWRKHFLGLPALAWHGPPRQAWPELYAFSPLVVPRPPDWATNQTITGYWWLPPDPSWQPPPQLVEWLAHGPPAIYIGFGSSGAHIDAQLLGQLQTVLNRVGVRAILGGVDPNFPLSDRCYVANSIHHDWLFSQLKTIVHHGGAGTTATALKAGVPQIVLPVGVDHAFWGQRIAALGVGPEPIAMRNFAIEPLVSALQECLDKRSFTTRAHQMASVVRNEQGVRCGVKILQSVVKVES
jgi:UDP:flavonoid glycosyltransferase YjiC (YdhE family)